MRSIISTKAASWLIASILAAGGAQAHASDNMPDSATNPEADNSKVNRRHEGNVEMTADQQSNDEAALETTRRIRKALTENDSLSTYARNVKIIYANGEVVLKGPVRSVAEKQSVERIAEKMAGSTKIKSELQVTSH